LALPGKFSADVLEAEYLRLLGRCRLTALLHCQKNCQTRVLDSVLNQLYIFELTGAWCSG